MTKQLNTKKTASKLGHMYGQHSRIEEMVIIISNLGKSVIIVHCHYVLFLLSVFLKKLQ